MRIIRKVTKADWIAIRKLAAEFNEKYGEGWQDREDILALWPAGLDRVLGTTGAIDLNDSAEFIVGCDLPEVKDAVKVQ